MDTATQDEKRLHRLLDAMENPDSLREEELCSFARDPENREDARILMEYREVMARHKTTPPDAIRTWNDFRQKKIRRNRSNLLTGMFIGAAASVLLFLGGYFWFQFQPSPLSRNCPIVAFTANPLPQEVVLSTGNGLMISLSDRQSDSTLQKSGILRQEEGLNYRQAAPRIEMHSLTTPRGGYFQLTLEDGTEVWLNAESRLTYPSRFTGNQRIVELQGEGYFKVARNTRRPFIVKAGKTTTEVLGTEFNVRTYSPDDSHITLLKGSVKVKNNISQKETVIHPGEDAYLQQDGNIKVTRVDTDNYYLWTQGYFYFDDKTLMEIMRDLGRWYNVRIEFNNPEVMNYRLHFLAERDQKIEEAIKLLNSLKKVKATYTGDKIVIE